MGSYFGIAVISKEIANVPELQYSRHSNKDYKLTATKVWLELKKATLALAENKLDPRLHTPGCSRCGGAAPTSWASRFSLKKFLSQRFERQAEAGLYRGTLFLWLFEKASDHMNWTNVTYGK